MVSAHNKCWCVTRTWVSASLHVEPVFCPVWLLEGLLCLVLERLNIMNIMTESSWSKFLIINSHPKKEKIYMLIQPSLNLWLHLCWNNDVIDSHRGISSHRPISSWWWLYFSWNVHSIGRPLSSIIAKITTAEMGGAFVVCQKISYTHCRQSSASAFSFFWQPTKAPPNILAVKLLRGRPIRVLCDEKKTNILASWFVNS